VGEANTIPFKPTFNSYLDIEARPERLTGEAGAVLLREIDERLGVTKWLAERLEDPRNQDLITHPYEELLRTAVYLKAQGWRDQDDADWLRDDPALRLSVSDRRGDAPLRPAPTLDSDPELSARVPEGLGSQPTQSRLIKSLSELHNRTGLREGVYEVARRRLHAMHGRKMRYITLDVDSLPIDVHGDQIGAEYNGYYHRKVFHPLVANIAGTGDLLDLKLRPGRAHTAHGAVAFILPLIDRLKLDAAQVVSVRFDAGFPEPEVLDELEHRRIGYVCRIKKNSVLDKLAEPFIRRPPGRRPNMPRLWFHELVYRAESWSRPRRVVLVVKEHEDDLFLDYFFLLTNWSAETVPPEELVDHYRERGNAENYLGELVNVLAPALSCTTRQKSHYRHQEPKRRYPHGDSFAANEVVLLLAAIAYNLMHAARLLASPTRGPQMSLKRLREHILRVPARLLLSGRYITLVIAEGYRELWQTVCDRIRRLNRVPQPSPS
jgi:hypothetical protein